MGGVVSGTLEMPSLGRPFQLGMLYDARSDKLIPGVTLWDAATIAEHLDTPRNIRSTDFEIIAEDSIDDKSTALDISASLKLSFLGGLVSVSGSASYLDDRKSTNHKARVTLKSKTKTTFQQLTMTHLGKGNAQYKEVFDDDIATHVVSGVEFGANAFFVFDREISDEENERAVHGDLSIAVKSLPGIEISGSGAVDIKGAEREKVEKFQCTFHGDVLPDHNPTTYIDAIEIYRKLPEMIGKNGENAKVIKVYLYPLGNLDKKAEKLVREISVNLINQVGVVFEGLNQLAVRANDIMNETACQFFPRIRRQLSDFQEKLREYKETFQRQLKPLIPEIKGGQGAEESELAAALKAKAASPFSFEKLNMWIDEKEREMKILKSYVFLEPVDLEKEIRDHKNNYVCCFKFKLAGSEDSYLTELKGHLDGSSQDGSSQGGSVKVMPWYQVPGVDGTMMNNARNFKTFASANNANKEMASKVTKFIIADEVLAKDYSGPKGAFLALYRDGVLIDDNFEPPSSPQDLKVGTVTHDNICLQWSKPQHGLEHMERYEVLYRAIDGTISSEVEVEEVCLRKFTITNLKKGTPYEVGVRSVCEAGVSATTKTADAVVTDMKTKAEEEDDERARQQLIGHDFYVVSELNGLVLDISERKKAPGTPVIMWSNKSRWSQTWHLDDRGIIRSRLNEFTFDTSSGQCVMQPYDRNNPERQWKVSGSAVANEETGKVLNICECNTEEGAKVIGYPLHNVPNDRWIFEKQ